MESSFVAVAHLLREAGSFVEIGAALVRALSATGYRGVALVALDGGGRPGLWVGNTELGYLRARAYVDGEYREDRALTRVCNDAALIAVSSSEWLVPVLACNGVIGILRVTNVANASGSELAAIGCLVSVRLAQIGFDSSCADHAGAVLTDRQHEIACLVARGCTNIEIADMLDISANAVKKHVSRLLELTEMSNRTELAALAGRWLADRRNPATREDLVVVAARRDTSKREAA